MIKAKNIFNKYSKSGPIETTNANSVVFINVGTMNVIINNVLVLAPNDTLSLSQVSPDIIDETSYNIDFSSTGEAIVDTPSLFVIKTIIAQNKNCK